MAKVQASLSARGRLLLERELDCWERDGHRATFWWRDDDAVDVTPRLLDLISVVRGTSVPLALAVIPSRATDALSELIRYQPGIVAVQHGFKHKNHEPPTGLKMEFGPHRVIGDALADIRLGRNRMRALFQESFLPVLVPPWNRIDPRIFAHLAKLGIEAVSAFGARRHPYPASRLSIINVHCDLIDWQKRASLSEIEIIAQLVRQLRDRRTGRIDPVELIGLLTHHLLHEQSFWELFRALVGCISGHPAAAWLQAHEIVYPAIR